MTASGLNVSRSGLFGLGSPHIPLGQMDRRRVRTIRRCGKNLASCSHLQNSPEFLPPKYAAPIRIVASIHFAFMWLNGASWQPERPL